jgi:arylformamidase
MTPGGARYLRDHTSVRLVGIDTLSVEAFSSPGYPVHRMLLAEEPLILVVEGLDLAAAPEGDYELLCLPLRLVGGDGAPARAVLRPL